MSLISDNKKYIDEFSDKENKLINLEIVDNNINYGSVVKFKYYHTVHETIMCVITDKDYEFDAAQLLSIMRQIELQEQGIKIVYPDGSDYSKRVFGPKRKRRAKVINSSSHIHPSQLLQ